jgi:para-aminobenzoate synthetase component 1
MTNDTSIEVKEMPYFENVAALFASFAHFPWSIFLDSGRPNSSHGRYDIISAFPHQTFLTRAGKTIIESAGYRQIVPNDPFRLVQAALDKANLNTQKCISDLPFTGGALGYFSYDLGRYVERMPATAKDDIAMPEMAIGIYRWAYVVDHDSKTATLVGDHADHRVRLRWSEIVEWLSSPRQETPGETLATINAIESNMSKQEYIDKFKQVKKYIGSGDCYQVNLAQRFSAKVQGDPWHGYLTMRTINPSPFSAYLNVPGCHILSASPERFLSVRDHVVETKPIKGTRPRGKDPAEEKRIVNELLASTKDRAENVMIVDLLRNDISKCCVANSVKVPKLFALESFPTVHHLVSTVVGELRDDIHPLQLLRACFPGGSITGAPKIRAMQIIEELEPHRRGIYCGSIGYIDFNGNMDTNIAIRTLTYKDQQIYFYAGGGLVWDSNAEEEYQETFDKAAAMFKLFNQDLPA